MDRVTLNLFGTAELASDEGPLVGLPARRYPLALLALLASARHYRLSRPKLIALLWPETSEDKGRNRLNTYVHHIRSGLGEEILLSLGDDLRLNTDALHCDVCAFRTAVEAGHPHEAVRVYGGPFLDGFHLGGSAAFDMRIDRERDRFRREYRQALETLAEEAESRQDFRAAADLWRELLEEDPYDARTVQLLMECLVRSGNRPAALKAAEAHRRRLGDDIGIEPPESLAKLVADVKADSLPQRVTPARSAPPAERSIAVLPFQNITGTDEASIFVEGLHADVVTELSRLSSLVVISRSSVLHYRDSDRSAKEIAGELGVRAVIQGQVQQEGRTIRLHVQLIDAARDVYLWAERYDIKLSQKDLFSLQNELTRRIAGALKAELSTAEEARLQQIPTKDLDAYRLYIRGRTRLEPRTEADLKAAADLFRSAISRDEKYAAAWAGLADALGFMVSYFHVPGQTGIDEAMAAARRAIELDPELADGYAALGLVHMDRKDGPNAVRTLRHAVELSPNHAGAHGMLGWVYASLGRNDQAWHHLRKAERLNPMMPENQVGLAYGHMLVGYAAEHALRHASRAQELAPGYAVAYLIMGQILADSGRPKEAALKIQRGLDRSSPESRRRHLASLVFAYQLGGEHHKARRALRELEGLDEGFFLGMANAAVGEIDRAFALLEKVDWTAHHAAHVRHDGALESLRSDPRYDELIRKVNRQWGLRADGSMPDLVDAQDDGLIF